MKSLILVPFLLGNSAPTGGLVTIFLAAALGLTILGLLAWLVIHWTR